MKDAIGKGKGYEDKREDGLRQKRLKERGLFSLQAKPEDRTNPYRICSFV